MTDNKVFLVSEEYAKYLEDNFDIKLKNSLTPLELSQQFLSKELVLRKIDEMIEKCDVVMMEFKGATTVQAQQIALLAVKEVLNECSATPENSALLKKLESV